MKDHVPLEGSPKSAYVFVATLHTLLFLKTSKQREYLTKFIISPIYVGFRYRYSQGAYQEGRFMLQVQNILVRLLVPASRRFGFVTTVSRRILFCETVFIRYFRVLDSAP